jgi:hygromycin-B 7''-O-kinase
VPYADRVAVARFLGPVVRRIHALEPGPESPLRPSWEAFDAFLEERRARCAESHSAWGSLPEHLVAQLDAYVPSVGDLVDHGAPPRVLHCDLNADHILGAFEGGRWRPAGIIDFGDAKVGDPVYELVALHIGLFRCDKRLLRTFLASYGADEALQCDLARRAMAMTLLHEFDVLSDVFETFPEARDVATLPGLAGLIWDPDGPGLAGRAGSV